MPGIQLPSREFYESDYTEIVKETDPLVHWTLGERWGATAYDVTGNGFHGAVTGATLGRPGIGDGLTSMFFDGLNDFVNIFSPGLLALFDGALGSEGAVMIWAQVYNVDVWTDGNTRSCFIAEQSFATNRISIIKAAAANRIDWRYKAAGVTELIIRAETTTSWMQLAKSWSKSAGVDGEMRAYFDGAQEGATQTGLGVWGDNVVNTRMNIGAVSTTPAELWHGWLQHAAVWDRPITPATVQHLYRARWTR